MPDHRVSSCGRRKFHIEIGRIVDDDSEEPKEKNWVEFRFAAVLLVGKQQFALNERMEKFMLLL